MRILEIAPYITYNGIKLLSQCKSGFGYMVYDIAESISKTEQVDMLLFNYRYNDFKIGRVNFIGTSFLDFVKHLSSCCSIGVLLNLFGTYKMMARTQIRMIYIWILSGYYYSIIKKGNYDIVHIHSCCFADEFLIDICEKLNQKFIITLHGLDSFSESVKLEPAGKQYEKNFLNATLEKSYNMTVIATGIKRTILEYFKAGKADNIHVVNNAFSFNDNTKNANLNIRSQWNIPHEAKVLLYVGNICERKNQKQIITAYNQLNSIDKENLYIMFLGRDIEPDYKFAEFVNRQEYKDHFKLCGNVDKERMPQFYHSADGVALMSLSEGFGLSLIEALHFGIPCMSFDIVDAYNDIYDSCCMIGVNELSDNAVSEGLHKLISKKWDKEKIKEYSKRFESSAMAANYIYIFKQIVEWI